MIDPCAGCGATILAAEGLGRRLVGIDVDPKAETVIREQMGKRLVGAGLPGIAAELTVRKNISRSDVRRVPDADLRRKL